MNMEIDFVCLTSDSLTTFAFTSPYMMSSVNLHVVFLQLSLIACVCRCQGITWGVRSSHILFDGVAVMDLSFLLCAGMFID